MLILCKECAACQIWKNSGREITLGHMLLFLHLEGSYLKTPARSYNGIKQPRRGRRFTGNSRAKMVDLRIVTWSGCPKGFPSGTFAFGSIPGCCPDLNTLIGSERAYAKLTMLRAELHYLCQYFLAQPMLLCQGNVPHSMAVPLPPLPFLSDHASMWHRARAASSWQEKSSSLKISAFLFWSTLHNAARQSNHYKQRKIKPHGPANTSLSLKIQARTEHD